MISISKMDIGHIDNSNRQLHDRRVLRKKKFSLLRISLSNRNVSSSVGVPRSPIKCGLGNRGGQKFKWEEITQCWLCGWSTVPNEQIG